MNKPAESPLHGREYYQWLFVVILIAASLFVMSLSLGGGMSTFDTGFFQKKLLIGTFNHLRLVLGDRVFPEVLIGKNGWMEYTGEGNLDDFQNAEPLSPEELATAGRSIAACQRMAADHNITFLVVVAPNKATIYPDMLPPQVQPLSRVSRLDQLTGYLSAHHIPGFLDLRPALREARQHQQVYFQTGTHWDAYGAFAAYTAILKALSPSYPALKPHPANFFQFGQSAKPTREEDLPALIGVDFLHEQKAEPQTDMDPMLSTLKLPDSNGLYEISSVSDSSLPSLLLFNDSFGIRYLDDMLILHFGKSFLIRRPSTASYLNEPSIQLFSPNIVIYEVAERGLKAILQDLSGCAPK